MTTSTSLSGRALAPKPPAKGSFPLDHLGECKAFAQSYEDCLRENNKQAGKCREEARKYLLCRMESGLMAKEDWKNLGLNKEKDRPDIDIAAGANTDARTDEKEGFVSGMRLANRRKARRKDPRQGQEPDKSAG